MTTLSPMIVDGAIFEPVSVASHKRRADRFQRIRANVLEDRKLGDPAGRDARFWTPDRTRAFLHMWACGRAAEFIGTSLGTSRVKVLAKASALGLLATHSSLREPYNPCDPEQRAEALDRLFRRAS